jgi:hypothetical protein
MPRPSLWTRKDSDIYMADPPPFPDLILVAMSPHRRRDWPNIYLCPDHPQWRKEAGKSYRRKAYVYICDTTLEGMEKALLLGASIEPPGLGDIGIEQFGMPLSTHLFLLCIFMVFRIIWTGRWGCPICQIFDWHRHCTE